MSKDNNDNNKPKLPVLLCNGRYVHPDMIDIVLVYLEARIPLLSPDNVLTLSQIIGEDNWDDLNRWIR